MSNEQKYFDVLKRIAVGYASTDELKQDSEQDYGLPYEETLEMAYENIQQEAQAAIKNKRRPKQ